MTIGPRSERNDTIDRHLERMFLRVLHEAEGDPPQLRRVELREGHRDYGLEIRAEFAVEGQPSRFIAGHVSRRELLDGPPMSSGPRSRIWLYDTGALWSRMYEDHYVNRMVRAGANAARELAVSGQLDAAHSMMVDVSNLANTARRGGHRIDFAREYQQRVTLDPAILAEPVLHQTATEVRIRQDEAARRMTRDIERRMLAAYGASTSTVAAADQPMTTARILESIRALGMVPTHYDWRRLFIDRDGNPQWDRIDPADFYRNGWFSPSVEVGTKDAQERGLQLLKENLTEDQRASYDKNKYFDVKGGKSGKTYRIHHGRQMNITELDDKGNRASGLCALPRGGLVSGDCMLAQKVALECDEAGFLKIANRF